MVALSPPSTLVEIEPAFTHLGYFFRHLSMNMEEGPPPNKRPKTDGGTGLLFCFDNFATSLLTSRASSQMCFSC